MIYYLFQGFNLYFNSVIFSACRVFRVSKREDNSDSVGMELGEDKILRLELGLALFENS